MCFVYNAKKSKPTTRRKKPQYICFIIKKHNLKYSNDFCDWEETIRSTCAFVFNSYSFELKIVAKNLNYWSSSDDDISDENIHLEKVLFTVAESFFTNLITKRVNSEIHYYSYRDCWKFAVFTRIASYWWPVIGRFNCIHLYDKTKKRPWEKSLLSDVVVVGRFTLFFFFSFSFRASPPVQ